MPGAATELNGELNFNAPVFSGCVVGSWEASFSPIFVAGFLLIFPLRTMYKTRETGTYTGTAHHT
jgi:hypothetical protein